MTRPSDTEAVTLTEQEREVIGWWDDGRYGCHHTEHVCPTPDECRGKYGLVAAVEQIVADAVAARLAGAGAQVTEAAVEPETSNDLCECGHFMGWHDPSKSGHVGMCLWPNGWPDKRECKCDAYVLDRPAAAETKGEA